MRRGGAPSGVPTTSIIAVGDELLYGETDDTNGSWLARELSRIGLSVRRRWVVGDAREAIRAAVDSALESAEVVVVTGGLGPTSDDRTRETVSEALNMPLGVDVGLMERLGERFRARGYKSLPAGAEAMAMVPAGATVLANPNGAAPGLVLEPRTGGLCVLLPGIPGEMKGIVSSQLEDFLVVRYGTRLRGVVHQVIHTVGIPESALAAQVESVFRPFADRVSLAYLPDDLGVRLRLSARFQPDRSGAEGALREVEEVLAPILFPYRYHAESGDLAEAVSVALFRDGKTLAVAESCTGGLISKRMTDVPGSSRFFLGGIVAYANEVKSGLLNIDSSLMAEEGVVSEAVAEALAEGAIRTLGADVGVGVTGIAGPGGGSPEKPVGTVCFAVSGKAGTVSRRELLPGDREAVRARAAHFALGLLLRVLDGRSL